MPTANTDFPIVYEETPNEVKESSYFDLVATATGETTFPSKYPETPQDQQESWYYEQVWLGNLPPLIIF